MSQYNIHNYTDLTAYLYTMILSDCINGNNSKIYIQTLH